MMKLCRTSSFRGMMDQPNDYLDQFPTTYIAWSRIIWDIAAIAALKNPSWTPSRLIPAPVLQDDFRWQPGTPDRHSIRVVNYCYRNMIFGDMFAALAGK